MASAGRLDTVASLLSREQWAMVLILAGAVLLVAPPDRPGLALALWFLGVLGGSFVAVLVASRVWARLGR